MRYCFFHIKAFFVVLNLYWKYHIIELLLCSFLKKKRRHDDLITQDDVERIKYIDSGAFPNGLRMFNDCNTVEDLIKSCECLCVEQMYFFHKSDWYILVVRQPGYVIIKSFASYTGRCNDFMTIVTWLFDNFKKDKVKVLARESTSYKLLLSFKRRNRVIFLKDKRIVMDNEFFHEIVLKANNRHKRLK